MNDSIWNLKAKLYRCLRSKLPFNLVLKTENKKLELILHSIVIAGKKVIDLGTGTGNVFQFLVSTDIQIGIDSTFSMLKLAKESYPEANFIQADALKLPLKNDSVELVTAVGLSEYLKDVQPLFTEINHILRSNGYLIITFSPFGMWTRLRLLLGHNIYPRTFEQLITIAKNSQFQFVKNSYSFMQGQVLFKKIATIQPQSFKGTKKHKEKEPRSIALDGCTDSE